MSGRSEAASLPGRPGRARAGPCAVILLLSVAAAAHAQSREDDLTVRVDRPNSGAAPVVTRIEGGWHILTGAAAIFYGATGSAEAPYRVRAEFALYDPARRNEGFGLLLGGRSLADTGIEYVYFLIRRDGSSLVKARKGDETRTVRGWAIDEAIRTWDGRPEGADRVTNHLEIEVRGDSVRFTVNGRPVFRGTVPAASLDGVVGVRVNHGVSLDVVGFEVEAAGNARLPGAAGPGRWHHIQSPDRDNRR